MAEGDGFGGTRVSGKRHSHFYGAAHHQGDVYPCTAASLPFLFDLADSAETPDRASGVRVFTLCDSSDQVTNRTTSAIRTSTPSTTAVSCQVRFCEGSTSTSGPLSVGKTK